MFCEFREHCRAPYHVALLLPALKLKRGILPKQMAEPGAAWASALLLLFRGVGTFKFRILPKQCQVTQSVMVSLLKQVV